MDPLTIGALLGSAQVAKAIREFAADESKDLTKKSFDLGLSSLIHRLKPTEKEKAAKIAVTLFADAWFREVEDTTPLTSSLPGYHDQLRDLLRAAAPEIAEFMDPTLTEIELGPVERIWQGIKKTDLPNDFEWTHVARNFARAIKRQFRDDPDIRAIYETVLKERTAEAAERTASATERMAGPAPGFDLRAYKEFLVNKKCNALQLASMHFSTYGEDRKILLWSVFIPQLAREAPPIVEISPEALKSGRHGQELEQSLAETDEAALIRKYKSIPVKPVLDLITQKPHLVITGDPGAGKSALLKYLALRWTQTGEGQIPVLIDLKEYGKTRQGFLRYCQSGVTLPRIESLELDRLLTEGKAALLLDGLDEIFDQSHRQTVVEEIISFSATYPQAQVIITSRKVGYRPERFSSAGFKHITLEDFDESQISLFLERWYSVAEDDEQKRARFAAQLKAAVAENASIRELAGNPLLLTMMAILNRHQELPRNRVALYKKAVEVLLHEWDSSRALHAADIFDLDDKEAMLRELAGDMQQERGGLAGNLIGRGRLVKRFQTSLENLGISDSHNKALALVQQLHERDFILASAGGGFFSFVHRTFLEYFCAAWLVSKLQTTRELKIEELRDEVFGAHWKDEKWHQVLRLIVGLVSPADAGELIQYLAQQTDNSGEHGNLLVAGACLYEIRNRRAIDAIDQELNAQFKATLMQEGSDEDKFEPQLKDTDWRSSALRLMGTLWPGEETLIWMRLAGETSRSARVQRAVIRELARTRSEDPSTSSWLKRIAMTTMDWKVGDEAASEVARLYIHDPETPLWLRDVAQTAQNEGARREAITVLAKFDPHDTSTRTLILKAALEDIDWYVRAGAVGSIVNLLQPGPDAFEVLLKLAEDQDYMVLKRVVTGLVRKYREEAETLPTLIRIAKDRPEKSVRRFTFRILCNFWPSQPQVEQLKAKRAESAARLRELRRSAKSALIEESKQMVGHSSLKDA